MSLLPPLSTKSAKFEAIGDTITGKLIEIGDEQQQREYSKNGDGGPAFWDKDTKTRPKMQRRFLLECPPNPNDPEDDGRRGVYATVSAKQGGMYAAIESALRGASALEGLLTVTFVGTDPESANPQNPRKLYTATYQPPALLGGAAPAAPEQQAPPVQQPAQPAAAAAPAQVPQAGQIPAQPPAGSGVDADTWARMPAATQPAIIAGLQQSGGQAPY